MNGTIWFRADHDLIGRVLAEKHRRRLNRETPVEGEGFRLCLDQQLREGLKAVRASGRVG